MCQLLVQLKKPPRRRQSIKGEDAEITYFSQARQCPHRVISGRFAQHSNRSAFGGKADVDHGPAEGPLLAISGHGGIFSGALRCLL